MSTASNVPDRLSVSKPKKLPPRPFSAAEMATLRRVADTLIPPGDGVLSGAGIAEFDAQVTKAAAILDKKHDALLAGLQHLAGVPMSEMWDVLKGLSEAGDPGFDAISTVLVGAYLYSDEVKARLTYPVPHRNPPDFFDAADELSSGILDPVISGSFTFRAAD